MNQRTDPNNQNIELGKVSWIREYESALTMSAAAAKPVLLFFQEIPGCTTCVNYGRDVLSHPLMVELIENEFVPLAIHNNKPGRDAEILARYNEPSWNNPVTRFVDASGNDIIDKLANNYHPLSLYQKMLAVLRECGHAVPNYAHALGDELKITYGFAARTIYETPCFWSGETSMAQKAGVLTTMAGWIGGEEVVEVVYDPEIVSADALNAYAIDQGFALASNHAAFKIDKEPQYYLSKSRFAHLPLTLAQRTKVNLAIPYELAPESYLSPKQMALLAQSDGATTIAERYMEPIEHSWRYGAEN